MFKKRTRQSNTLFSPRSRMFHAVNDMLAVFSLLAVILIVLESVDAYAAHYFQFFYKAEIVIIAIFMLEYGVSFLTAPKKLGYVFSIVGVADLLAFLPTLAAFFYPPFLSLRPLRVLKIIRVMRLLRVHKATGMRSYFNNNSFLLSHFDTQSWYNLRTYFFALGSTVTIFGTLIYLAERDIAGSQFTNIPVGMWWAIVTLTTVGYGDIVPQTVLGRGIAACVMVWGLILFAILVSIVRKIAQKIILGKREE